jgi:hypothetical protein
MAERTVFHVTPSGKQWQVKQVNGANADDPTLFATKNEAVDKGRELAQAVQPSQLVIHTADGKIETEHTYQDDPFPPRG